MKNVESTSLEVNRLPSKSVEHHQPIIEEETPKHDNISTTERKNAANKEENITNTEQQVNDIK
jgi:hypothetical protein